MSRTQFNKAKIDNKGTTTTIQYSQLYNIRIQIGPQLYHFTIVNISKTL